MRILSLGAIVGGCAVIALATIAVAVKTTGSDATPVEVLTYRPVTSDLMNAFIQPRHIKLFLAGSAQNWEYAEYERHNIGGALGRLAIAVPDYNGQSMERLIEAFATPQLAALDAAIKAKDVAAFRTAYEGLTTGCNQCHQATGHGMVVLQTPATNSFPDQVFRAAGG
jgi:cytochrome c553